MAFYGIDLGTTFSSVALSERGAVRLVPLHLGARTLASTVLLDASVHEHPRVLVGAAASVRYRDLCAQRHEAPPGVTLVRGSKNHMGVARAAAGPPWRFGDTLLGATDVAALVLRALAVTVAQHPSLPPLEAAVVTHPQRFRNRERRATAQAVHLAGLRAVALLPEPDAAAWAYGFGAQHTHDTTTFMVFDFGGGTLDVTVMRRSATQLDALASYGVQLGGLGVDEALREQLFERMCEGLGRSVSFEVLDEASRESLLAVAEGMKVQLNAHATGDVNPAARMATRTLTLHTVDGEVLGPCAVRMTLGELSTLIHETIERAVDCATEALSLAALSWSRLDAVLLVGGSSWLHGVQTRLRGLAGDRVRIFDDVDDPLNPATAVAAGAARYAEHLAREGRSSSDVVSYHGVIPDAFGVRAKEPDPTRAGERRDALALLVPALTRVPFEGRRTFRKRGEGALSIEVLEGRSLAEATSLGRFVIETDRALPDGAPIDVTLRVTREGVFSLEVRDTVTGGNRVVTLTDAEGLYADDELEARRHFIAALPIEVA